SSWLPRPYFSHARRPPPRPLTPFPYPPLSRSTAQPIAVVVVVPEVVPVRRLVPVEKPLPVPEAVPIAEAVRILTTVPILTTMPVPAVRRELPGDERTQLMRHGRRRRFLRVRPRVRRIPQVGVQGRGVQGRHVPQGAGGRRTVQRGIAPLEGVVLWHVPPRHGLVG